LFKPNLPLPNIARLRHIAAMIKVYSTPPFIRKNPFLKCTVTAAIAISIKSSPENILVPRPIKRQKPPISSKYAARYAHSKGGVKPRLDNISEKFLIPDPANIPYAFWSPCAINITPKLNLSGILAHALMLILASFQGYR